MPEPDNDHWTADYSREELLDERALQVHEELMSAAEPVYDTDHQREVAQFHVSGISSLDGSDLDDLLSRVWELIEEHPEDFQDPGREPDDVEEVVGDDLDEIPDITEYGPSAGDTDD